MGNTKQYRVKLIEDTPASKDDFGAHERIATAIAELIDTQGGGITIGLEGGWGSGKSTVINLVKERFQNRNDHAVVLFDAWAHQGDPLRRTFLETIIKHLQQLRWIEEEKWNKARAELARRRSITETKTIPRLGFLGSLLALSVLLVPVGLAVLSAGLQEATSLQSSTNPSPQSSANLPILLGSLCTLLPPIILFTSLIPQGYKWLRSIWSRFWSWIRQTPYTPPARASDDSLGWGSLLAQQQLQDTHTETIENPDPTSVEFEEIFTNLMAESLNGQQRRLILALDNLDRVTPSDALSILAALQTFLHHSEHSQPDWFGKLYVLIPYDPRGLQRLWEGQGEDDNSRVAVAFLDKTFQLRFEIPPLLLSDWRTYLINLLNQAFPDHDATEFHATYRVFALQSRKDTVSPTPRDLKHFVNQIGTISRQWKDAFPLPQTAYYVLLRRKGENVPEWLLKGSLSDSDIIDLLGERPHDNLAAMAFNAPIDRARQLLLRSPLEESLGSGDVQAVKELGKYPGFWEVMQDIPFEDWAEKESIKLAQTAFCLDSSGLLANAESVQSNTVIRELKSAVSQVKTWSPLNTESAQGLVALLNLIPDVKIAETILSSLPPASVDAEQAKIAPNTVSPWVKGFILLLRGIKAQSLATAYAPGVDINLDADGYVELCAQIHTEEPDGEFWSVLHPKVSSEKVTIRLDEAVSSDAFTMRHVNAIRVMKQTQLPLPWNDAMSKRIETLRSGSPIDPSLVTMSLMTLWELQDADQSINAALDNLATQGHLLHHLHHVKSVPTAAAWCIFVFLQRIPAAVPITHSGNSETGLAVLNTEIFAQPQSYAEITNNFIELLTRYNQLSLMLQVLDACAAAQAWIIECLKLVATKPYASQVFTPEMLVSRWDGLEASFTEAEYDNLITTALTQTNLIDYLCSQDFYPEEAGLYTTIVQLSKGDTQEFYTWCQKGLNDIDSTRWQEQLAHEGKLAELVIDLVDKSVKLSFGSAYQDGLIAHGRLLIEGKGKPDYLKAHWFKLLKPLNTRARKLLRDALLNATERADGKIPHEFFDLYGDEISDYPTLKGNNDIVLNVFMPLLRERNERGLVWLAGVFTAHPDILVNYHSHHKEGFKDRVQEAIDDQEHEATSSILKIAEILNLQQTEASHEDSQD